MGDEDAFVHPRVLEDDANGVDVSRHAMQPAELFALAVTRQVDGEHAVVVTQGVDLEAPHGSVRGPAVHEDHGRGGFAELFVDDASAETGERDAAFSRGDFRKSGAGGCDGGIVPGVEGCRDDEQPEEQAEKRDQAGSGRHARVLAKGHPGKYGRIGREATGLDEGAEYMEGLKRFLGDVRRYHIEARLLRWRLRPDFRGEVETVDADTSSSVAWWEVPSGYLNAASICYCAGVGEHIGFELGLRDRYDSLVIMLDPTPRSVQFIAAREDDDPKLQFEPVGLWSSDETLRFYMPHDARHVSHSVIEGEGRDEYFEAPCRTLRTLMQERGHDRVDLLKMNIEGAEYEVLESLLRDEIYPEIICLTFEGQGAFSRTLRWTQRLRDAGYALVRFHAWAFTFARPR